MSTDLFFVNTAGKITTASTATPLPVTSAGEGIITSLPDITVEVQDNVTIVSADHDSVKVTTVNRKSSVAPAASPVTVAATAGGTTIAAANANRLSITIQNTGAEPCIVRLGGDPSTAAYNLVLAEDSGTRFGAGGSVTISDYTGAIKGITEANTTIVSILEVVTA